MTDWILMGRKGTVNSVLKFPSGRQGGKRCWCQMKHLGKLGLWGGGVVEFGECSEDGEKA